MSAFPVRSPIPKIRNSIASDPNTNMVATFVLNVPKNINAVKMPHMNR